MLFRILTFYGAIKDTEKKFRGSKVRIRVPFCSRAGKVIMAAKGKGSYRRAKKKVTAQELLGEH